MQDLKDLSLGETRRYIKECLDAVTAVTSERQIYTVPFSLKELLAHEQHLFQKILNSSQKLITTVATAIEDDKYTNNSRESMHCIEVAYNSYKKEIKQ